MYNLSSNDGPRFAEIAVEMDEKIRKLGPNPIKLAQNTAAWKKNVRHTFIQLFNHLHYPCRWNVL